LGRVTDAFCFETHPMRGGGSRNNERRALHETGKRQIWLHAGLNAGAYIVIARCCQKRIVMHNCDSAELGFYFLKAGYAITKSAI
jgi:hypothetical protein